MLTNSGSDNRFAPTSPDFAKTSHRTSPDFAPTSQGTSPTFTSQEIALRLNVTERTVQMWVKKLEEIYYWRVSDLRSKSGKYTQFTLTEMEYLQAATGTKLADGKPNPDRIPFAQYCDSIWDRDGKHPEEVEAEVEVGGALELYRSGQLAQPEDLEPSDSADIAIAELGDFEGFVDFAASAIEKAGAATGRRLAAGYNRALVTSFQTEVAPTIQQFTELGKHRKSSQKGD